MPCAGVPLLLSMCKTGASSLILLVHTPKEFHFFAVRLIHLTETHGFFNFGSIYILHYYIASHTQQIRSYGSLICFILVACAVGQSPCDIYRC
jgi:hypothetical protein